MVILILQQSEASKIFEIDEEMSEIIDAKVGNPQKQARNEPILANPEI